MVGPFEFVGMMMISFFFLFTVRFCDFELLKFDHHPCIIVHKERRCTLQQQKTSEEDLRLHKTRRIIRREEFRWQSGGS